MEALSRDQYLANKFPKTAEEFDRVEVLETLFVRIDLVRWMNRIDETEIRINESDDDREKFTFLADTMDSSFSNTNELYKIQAAKNLDERVHIHVRPENIYYNILFKAHDLWATITCEFQNIFAYYNVFDKHEFVFQIPTKPLTEKAILIVRAIVANERLTELMIQLQENSEIMLGYIQLWQNPFQPSTEP